MEVLPDDTNATNGTDDNDEHEHEHLSAERETPVESTQHQNFEDVCTEATNAFSARPPGFGNNSSFIPPNLYQVGMPYFQQTPRPRHPDFLDPETLAQEMNRMNLMAQPQLHFCNQPQFNFGHQLYTLLPVAQPVPLAASYEFPGYGARVQAGPGPPPTPFVANYDHWPDDGYDASGAQTSPPFLDEFGNPNPEILAQLQAQQLQFSELPSDAHQKIQSMPGYLITNVYPVTLIRFLSSTLIESTNSFAVFTQKPETGQNWLMAFAQKKDRMKTAIKFNRLLTAHLKVTMIGETAIELESSRLSKSFMGEQYVFSLRSAEDAQSFMQTLNYGRTQIWSRQAHQPYWSAKHDVLRPKNNFGSQGTRPGSGRPRPRRPSASSMGWKTVPIPGPSCSSNRFKSRSRNPIFCDDEILRSAEKRILEPETVHEKEEVPIITQDIAFSKELTLFIDDFDTSTGTDDEANQSSALCEVNSGIACKEFGVGMVCIIEKPGALNELLFVINNTEVVCHHKIYGWNEIVIDNQSEPDVLICAWNCQLVFANDEGTIPTLRQLLVKFNEHHTATQFHDAFIEAKLKADDLAKRPD